MKKLFAYAKINIFLEITGKRADGYHSIDSVMQTVSLCDEIDLEITSQTGISLSCPGIDIPQEKNLAYRAASIFFERAGLSFGAQIKVHKNIPSEAGLGGGSADAAAVLKALNIRFRCFSENELCDLGASLGSDVPFCIKGGCARAEGRGEILTPVSSGIPDCAIVIVKGKKPTSTAQAYRMIDSLDYSPKANKTLSALDAMDLKRICDSAFNRFEDAVYFDRDAADVMKLHGALTARLTGSGSAIFGIFDSDEKAEAAAGALKKSGYAVFSCRPVEGPIV